MTLEIALVLGVLLLAAVLFISEKLRGDVVAILVLLLLAWLGLVTPAQAFSGFGSDAVMSIIAVMIIGHGIERSGLTRRFVSPVIRLAGGRERGLLAAVSAAVGLLSSFLQNIGAAALMLPAVMRISRRIGLPASRILMPMGFAAILGGTITLVGSSPLIMLNDLLRQGGQPGYGLFSVTPVGLALLAGGMLLFLVFGRRILPATTPVRPRDPGRTDLAQALNLPATVSVCRIPAGSPLENMSVEEAGLWARFRLNLLAMREEGEVTWAPWRRARLAAGQELALLGERGDVERFIAAFGLERVPGGTLLDETSPGHGMEFAELIVPPRSTLAGKSLRQIALRRQYSVEPLLLTTGEGEFRGDFSDVPLRPGHILVVFGRAGAIAAMNDRRAFVLISPLPRPEAEPTRPLAALACFAAAVGLTIAGVSLPLSLLSGALAMILLRVISIDEAYRAVDWRTVFLLAGLIPLGIAMERSGAAAWIAGAAVARVGHAHPLALMFGVASLTTVFSLFMSNTAATALLVPLVLGAGTTTGIEPRALAMLVAVCASNSFLVPTHQVNALLLAPGGYRTADYIRAGGIMTLIFLGIAVPLIYILFT